MTVTTHALCADLAAEAADLAGRLEDLGPGGWAAPTPAPGWDVADQVGHLATFDERATEAIAAPDRFRATRRAGGAQADPVERAVVAARAQPRAAVAPWWAGARAALLAAAEAADPSVRVPWYGPDMSLASMVTARLMEAWAHGQDVADALGWDRPATGRLRHVAFLGYRALPNSFLAHGLTPPSAPVRVDLTGPSGESWDWGPHDADDRLAGPALDFCLLVTQRRHPDDLGLRASGPVARRWLTVAQAFAGPPGVGRRAGQFAAPAHGRRQP